MSSLLLAKNQRPMPVAGNSLNNLLATLSETEWSYHRLVLLIGPSNSGKTRILRQAAERLDCDILNVNLELSQRLLEVPRSRRPLQAVRIFREIVASRTGETVLLDNLEVLFDPALRLSPLQLLRIVSRNHTVVATWNGTMYDGHLAYAEPDHPEYTTYRDVDVKVVLTGPQKLNK